MRREGRGAAMAAVALLACGDDPTGTAGIAARLAIQPGQTQTLTEFGQTVQLGVVAHDAYNRPVSGVDVSWEARDAGTAGVDQTGLVTALGDGATYIIARHTDLADSVRVVVARPTEPFALELVSGDAQSGDAGRAFGEPLVVRVLNAIGAPVAGHPVLWSVPVDHGLIDGRVMHACRGPVPLPVPTDAEGLSRISFTPTTHGPIEVSAHLAMIPQLPVTFSADAAAALTVVSGTRREVKAGERISALPTDGALKALAVDGAGSPVAGVVVTWRITAGNGRILPLSSECEFDGDPGPHATTRSAPEGYGIDEPSGPVSLHGLSVVDFVPMAVGTSRIVATVGGPDAPAGAPLLAFEIDATGVLIGLDLTYTTGEPHFFAPDPVSSSIEPLGTVTVPVGTTVEWLSYLPTARIMSTAVPTGGASFDSGTLDQRESFEFVPGVPGTWEFIDQVSGATGTLRAE